MKKTFRELDLARIELVTAIHGLASSYENELGFFKNDPERLRQAQGAIAHAMKKAAEWNWNGKTDQVKP